MTDRHKVTTAWRPSSSRLVGLEAIADRRGITVRQAIALAVDELLAREYPPAQLADVDGFNRSTQLIDKVNGSAGLFAEARASSA